MENVTQQLRAHTHTLWYTVTQQKDTLKDKLGEKDTKQTAHTGRQTKTEEDINTQTVSRGKGGRIHRFKHTHTHSFSPANLLLWSRKIWGKGKDRVNASRGRVSQTHQGPIPLKPVQQSPSLKTKIWVNQLCDRSLRSVQSTLSMFSLRWTRAWAEKGRHRYHDSPWQRVNKEQRLHFNPVERGIFVNTDQDVYLKKQEEKTAILIYLVRCAFWGAGGIMERLNLI